MKTAKRHTWLVAPVVLVTLMALAGCGSSHHDHGDSTYYQPAGYRQEPQQQQRYDNDRGDQHHDNDQHRENNQHHDND